MSWVAIGTTGASLIGGALMGGGGSQTTSSPALTEEQKQILSMLGNYGKTGYLGDQNMEYQGTLGNYSKSGMEGAAQNKLLGYVTGAQPQIGSSFGVGQSALNKLIAGDYYDPLNDGGAYKGYKESVMRELGESKARAKRDAAVGGNLYSTNTVNKIGDLEAQAVNNMTNKTADLYQNYVNQRVNAIPQAMSYGLQEGQFNQNNQRLGIDAAGAAMSAGALDRALADQKAKDAYNNFLQNRQSRLGALGTALGTKATDNVISTPSTSPWSSLFNTGLSMGTNIMGQNYGKTGNLFKSGF